MRGIVIKCIDLLYKITDILFEIFFLLIPVKSKRIVCINFNGRGYGCNPKYICELLIRDKEQYDIIWLVSEYDYFVPNNIRKVKYHSIKALYSLASANVIITNTKNDLRIIKKRRQYVIQTWHASYSPKYLEKAAKLRKKYKKESEKNSKQTDYFLSNSRMQTKEYLENFWCESEILEFGYPRNDILLSNNRKMVNTIKSKVGINKNEYIILYAPTFRDDYKTSAYLKDIHCIKRKLEESGENWKFLIRLHPNAEKFSNIYTYDNEYINVTKYEDMQELLMISNILITDYSSSMFDFSIMKKPVFIYASDIEEYTNLRGLKPMFYKLPFPICTSENELVEKISTFPGDEYEKNVSKFMIEYGNFDQGNAAEKVCNLIKTKLIV